MIYQSFFAMMFTGKKKNKIKIEGIRLAPELLRIDSRYAKISGLTINFIIAIALLSLIFFEDIKNIIKGKGLEEQLVLISMAAFILVSVVFTFHIMNQKRGKSFIVTEKGLFINTDVAELWADIEGYRWESYAGLSRISFSGRGEGTSLVLVHRNVWPEYSILVQYGIFFTPDQIQKADSIFQRLGVKKLQI